MNFQIITYILVSFIILFISAKISYRFRLVDLPNKRKLHTEATAFTGGVAISLIFLVSILLFDYSDSILKSFDT